MIKSEKLHAVVKGNIFMDVVTVLDNPNEESGTPFQPCLRRQIDLNLDQINQFLEKLLTPIVRH